MTARRARRPKCTLVVQHGIGSKDQHTGFIPSEKGTPTVRSVRKAEGLEAETARLPKKRRWSESRSLKMPTEAHQP